ncbi:hypothetical protein H4V97_002727 [Flavobacterium sp. CG_23.5]|nr:hypothetical protein [Flavobacterium sp. CG_9.10]MBP2284409.1 hypothetical protein [Flavobacterium sp. CG_23.5]
MDTINICALLQKLKCVGYFANIIIRQQNPVIM